MCHGRQKRRATDQKQISVGQETLLPLSVETVIIGAQGVYDFVGARDALPVRFCDVFIHGVQFRQHKSGFRAAY